MCKKQTAWDGGVPPAFKQGGMLMKKRNLTKLFGLLLVMAAVLFLPKSALAATPVNNDQTVSLQAGVVYTFTLPVDTETLFKGTPGLMIRYGKSESSFDYTINLDSTIGMAAGPHVKGTYYFKIMSGDGEVTISWDEGNNSIVNATEFSLKPGESKRINQKGPYRYYLLNVTDPSAKYTFKTDNSVVHMDLLKGKRTEYVSADREFRVDQGETKTFVLEKGYYTIAGIAHSEPVAFTVTRENWVGITKITPSNDGKIIGSVGQKFDYEVYYEPKNADSKISVKSASAGSSARMTLKSQANGVAVFEVDFTNNDETKTYTLPYSSKETSREYNRVVFSSEDGVTATAEKMAGPKAPELYGTMTGSTKSISIPVQGQGNKYVAFIKSGRTWKKWAETTTNSNGIYYVNCKKLSPGKAYTFRVYAYSDGVQGGYLQVKGVTAYNLKPAKTKAVCTGTKFFKKKKSYEWRFNWTRGWYRVYFTDHSSSTIKVTYKIPKGAKGTYVTVNGQKLKSGKTLKVDRAGKTKAGTKSVVIFQCVRKSGKCIAYGPSVQVKCSLKAAR